MPTGVRPARAADAPAIAAVQSRAWRASFADLLEPETLAGLTAAALIEPWRRAVAEPPSSRHRVLVAVDDELVVAFAALIGIEITVLAVDPAHQRNGHGSRLLAAAVEAMQALGARRVQTWSPETDVARLRFLTSAGMAPDGARRTYERSDGVEVTEVRVAASLAEDSAR